MISLLLYQKRRQLTAKRNASVDPVERERINIMIEQLTNYDRATGMQRLALATENAEMAKEFKLPVGSRELRLICPDCNTSWYTLECPNECPECGATVTVRVIRRPEKQS